MKSRFRKEYSKIKFDTVSLCDNVKMAKAKDEEAVCLSGLSQPYGREILSGTPEQGEQ